MPTITSPGNYAWVNTAKVTLAGTADAGAVVELFDDGVSVGTTTVSALGSWSRQVPAADGAHLYTAAATGLGGTSKQSAMRVVQVDTTAPSAPVIISPSEGTTTGTTFTVSGTAEAGSTIELYEDGSSRGTIAASNATWTRTLSGVSAGTHTYSARATDIAGNVSTMSIARSLRVG
ncbi:Ig-like domain-containing protein [Solirubrobacter ginsenosidimutans]|uniref:Ig-like domain-containing protein n=1 Tax=Solirubrobacter ginsenosidimutans TaxID=490573 RepID=A0A9X3S8Z3_9ACTN|nr:Ig-like domain-containing protein [Solirubrobacter ginsenosidimutans]MDA0167416.1 Ig-like domain-containing protein [Solirubrobacter ginsenosidimutans]